MGTLHAQNAATAATGASDARPTCGLLTPAEAAPLLGLSRRRVAELIADGFFPANCVVRTGHGKKKAHVRLLLQRLIEARLVVAP